MFHCQSTEYGHIVFGSHDGVRSWTLNLDLLPASGQATVAQHEYAHHHLQSSSAWGTAMLAASLVGPGGTTADRAWRALADGCRTTHEMFATYVSVRTVADALDHYRGNLEYLHYYGLGARLVEPLDLAPAGVAHAIEDLTRMAMSPRWLAHMGFDDMRRIGPDAPDCPSPDIRLAALAALINRHTAVNAELRDVFETEPDPATRWDALCEMLATHGFACSTSTELVRWTREVVAACNRHLPVEVTIGSSGADPLHALLDNHARERLRLHAAPLPLQVGRAAHHEPRSADEFARTAAGWGPHVWLVWLRRDILTRQFDAPTTDLGEFALAMLACDRRGSQPCAFLSDFTPAAPALVHQAIAQHVRPLCFTTLRTLDVTPESVDFRSWQDVLVLIDSDLMIFLDHWRLLGEDAVWDVLGLDGSRTITFIVLQARSVPGLVYLAACSLPTGTILASWLNEQSDLFVRSRESFIDRYDWLRAGIEHLVGTFWMLDHFGAMTDPPPPRSTRSLGPTDSGSGYAAPPFAEERLAE